MYLKRKLLFTFTVGKLYDDILLTVYTGLLRINILIVIHMLHEIELPIPDKHECEVNNGGCDENELCIDSYGGHYCVTKEAAAISAASTGKVVLPCSLTHICRMTLVFTYRPFLCSISLSRFRVILCKIKVLHDWDMHAYVCNIAVSLFAELLYNINDMVYTKVLTLVLH